MSIALTWAKTFAKRWSVNGRDITVDVESLDALIRERDRLHGQLDEMRDLYDSCRRDESDSPRTPR